MLFRDRASRILLAVFMGAVVLTWTAWLSQAASPPLLVAQAPTDAGDLITKGELPTLATLFGYAPVINSIIAVLSAVALMLFVYFVSTVTTRSMMPPGFIDDVTKLVIGRQYKGAADLCRNHRHIFVASMIQRCVENADKEQSVIMEMLDTEGRRQADVLWNRISFLADVANVAPMLGLLGTVLGMIKAFFSLHGETASINSKVLSAGIGEAMATTMFGLVVAIVALVFYSLAKTRATQTLAEVEQTMHTIADHIKRDPTATSGEGG